MEAKVGWDMLAGIWLKCVNTLLILVSIQFLLGVLTILFINKAKVLLGVSHQVGAFFLLTATTFVLHRFSK